MPIESVDRPGDDLPLVGVCHARTVPSAERLDDRHAPPLEVCRLDAALLYPWDCDAHVVQYSTRMTGYSAWPRLRKTILPRLRLAGAEVLVSVLIQEFDNPNHAPWTAALWRSFEEWWQGAAEAGCVLARDYTYFYTTRAGGRLVYALDEPIKPEDAEHAHRGMVGEMGRWGLTLDPRCSDWTRLFRLPFVQRRGGHGQEDDPNVPTTCTWEDPFLETREQWSKRLLPDTIPRTSLYRPRESIYAEVGRLELPQPTEDEALAELFVVNPESGRRVMSDWLKEAKRRLQNRRCFGCLFENRPLAEPGARDATMFSFVGEAISLVGNLDESTPEKVYALFLPAAMQLDPDQQVPDWTVKLWDHVLRIWAKESAKLRASAAFERPASEEDPVVLARALLDRVREWCVEPKIHGNDDDALPWLLEHLIVKYRNSYHVMQRCGRYDNFATDEKGIYNRIRRLGMEPLIPIKRATEEGGAKTVSVADLILEYGTQVADARMTIEVNESGAHGARITAADTDQAQLVLTAFRRRTDLEPCYDAEVDEWLSHYAGGKYEKLCEWVARAIQVEGGPICALASIGSRGVGKKMLAYGIAECFTSEEVADKNDLTDAFQHTLLLSPVILVNEGFPNAARNDPADTFRALVAGDGWSVQRKFLPPVQMRCPYRVLIAANNVAALKTLCGRRDMSPEDIAALAQRLMLVTVTEECRAWLEDRGGKNWTGRPGRRWIRGDSGEASDYVVARHFLWLFRQWEKVPVESSRFLVEGDYDPVALAEMRTETGLAPLIVETLVAMLNRKSANKGLVVEAGAIYVLPAAVVEFFRKEMQPATAEKVTVSRVAQALLAVSQRVEHVRLNTRRDAGVRGWHVLDAQLLWQVCQRYGWSCEVLERIVVGPPVLPLHLYEKTKSRPEQPERGTA